MKTSRLLLAGLLVLALSSTAALRAQEAAGDTKSSPPKTEADKKSKEPSPEGGQKVSVNHKGKVITVDSHALKAHLAHGDTLVSDTAAGGDASSGSDTNAAAKSDKGRGKKKGSSETAAVSDAGSVTDTNAVAAGTDKSDKGSAKSGKKSSGKGAKGQGKKKNK